MRVGSLFSGVGGFDLGLERAGMTVVYQVEIEPYCQAVLKKHWPDVERHGDIRTVDFTALPAVDLLCGGFPCQDISVAGKGAGLEGDRSGLWYEFARAIKEAQPRWVIIENSPALRSRGLESILGTLNALGYDAEWHCIPAASLGAPHRRDRLWVIAYAQSIGCGAGWERRLDPGSPRECEQPLQTVADTQVRGACRQGEGDEDTRLGSPGGGQGFTGASANCELVPDTDRQSLGWPAKPWRQCDIWATEPDVRRVSYGVPLELDLIGGLEIESRDGTKTITETDAAIRSVLRYVWGYRGLAETSPDVYRRGLCDLVSSLSYERAQTTRVLGARIKEDKELCDLWRRFYSQSQQEAFNLQSELLERIRASQCSKAMVPRRTDRLRALGNAVVPQIPEMIGRAIMEYEHHD